MKKIINIGLTALMVFVIGACGGKDSGVKSVKIGEQIWMTKNLNDPSKGGVCYEDKPENCEKYGRLYNWDEAMKACPEGWLLPSDEEWQVLIAFAGGKEVAGGKLKAKRGWEKGGDGTDEYGFSALPGGYRSGPEQIFDEIGDFGGWWSATEKYEEAANSFDVRYGDSRIYDNGNWKLNLSSVRCVQGRASTPNEVENPEEESPGMSVQTVEFNGKEIPITVFYSQIEEDGSYNLDSLVFEHNGAKQTVNLLKNGGSPLRFPRDDHANINVADYNFDGYMDIQVLSSNEGDNEYYDVFMYDPQAKSYYYNKELSGFQVVVDIEAQTLRQSGSMGDPCWYWDTKYKWEKNELVVIKDEEQKRDSLDKFVRTTRIYQNGSTCANQIYDDSLKKVTTKTQKDDYCGEIVSIEEFYIRTCKSNSTDSTVKIGTQT